MGWSGCTDGRISIGVCVRLSAYQVSIVIFLYTAQNSQQPHRLSTLLCHLDFIPSDVRAGMYVTSRACAHRHANNLRGPSHKVNYETTKYWLLTETRTQHHSHPTVLLLIGLVASFTYASFLKCTTSQPVMSDLTWAAVCTAVENIVKLSFKRE